MLIYLIEFFIIKCGYFFLFLFEKLFWIYLIIMWFDILIFFLFKEINLYNILLCDIDFRMLVFRIICVLYWMFGKY